MPGCARCPKLTLCGEGSLLPRVQAGPTPRVHLTTGSAQRGIATVSPELDLFGALLARRMSSRSVDSKAGRRAAGSTGSARWANAVPSEAVFCAPHAPPSSLDVGLAGRTQPTGCAGCKSTCRSASSTCPIGRSLIRSDASQDALVADPPVLLVASLIVV